MLTVFLGIAYPVFVWLVAQLPGLNDKANGSLVEVDGKLLGSSLIASPSPNADGNALPQYFQAGRRRQATGMTRWRPAQATSVRRASSIHPDKPSLLTLSATQPAVGKTEGVDGTRPFCTGGGVGAVLSVIGPRDAQAMS